MADRHLFVTDSIGEFTWPETVVAARAGATLVARSPFDTINSPSYAGTTLMNWASTSVIGAWGTRVQPYLGSADRLYFEIGVNDYYNMLQNVTPVRDYESFRAAWATVNTNWLAASPRPARVYLIGLPYVTGLGTVLTAAPPWCRACLSVPRKIMNDIMRDACARYSWTYVSLDAMSPDMLLGDGLHPNPAGVAYYTSQVLAAG